MVPFDIPLALAAAGGLGWRAHGQRRDVAVTCAGLGVAVPGLAFLEAYPDWDWSYLVDPATLPGTEKAVFVALVLLMGWLGHWIGSHHPRWLLAPVLFLVVYPLVLWDRTLHVGTREAWLAGQAPVWPPDFLLFATVWFSMAGVVWAWGVARSEAAGRAVASAGT